jgi:hypothetical protein
VASVWPADSPAEFFAANGVASARGLGRPPGSWRCLQGPWLLRYCYRSSSAVSPAVERVADRWPSPRAHLGLVSGSNEDDTDLRGTSCPIAPWGRVPSDRALVTFASPSEMLSSSRGPFSVHVVWRPGRRSEDLLLVRHRLRPDRDSSLGVVNDRPSVDIVSGVHSRSSPRSEERPRGFVPVRGVVPFGAASIFGPELPNSELVPPLSFLPTSAVYSAGHFAGFLHPAADHGVRHVSEPRLARFTAVLARSTRLPVCVGPPKRTSASVVVWPRSCLAPKSWPGSWSATVGSRVWGVHPRWRHTLRSFPLAGSRATSPWSLPSRRCARFLRIGQQTSSEGRRHPVCRLRALGLKALLRRRVRCADKAFPPNLRPLLPWASELLQGIVTRVAVAVRRPVRAPRERCLCGSGRVASLHRRAGCAAANHRAVKGRLLWPDHLPTTAWRRSSWLPSYPTRRARPRRGCLFVGSSEEVPS